MDIQYYIIQLYVRFVQDFARWLGADITPGPQKILGVI